MSECLYRLEIIDKDGTQYTVLGGLPCKEAYQDWLEQGDLVGGRIEVQGLFCKLAVERQTIKVMILECINPNR